MTTVDLDKVSVTTGDRLVFHDDFNGSLIAVVFPQSLTSITFGERFNRSLVGVVFPSTLTSIEFGSWFDKSLECVKFPPSLISIKFGEFFDQPLNYVVFPPLVNNIIIYDNYKPSLEKFYLSHCVTFISVEYSPLKEYRKDALLHIEKSDLTETEKWSLIRYMDMDANFTTPIFIAGSPLESDSDVNNNNYFLRLMLQRIDREVKKRSVFDKISDYFSGFFK